MDLSLFQTIYIFIATFIGESFGTMFGGGSFFIQPALLIAEIPPDMAVANDITAAVFSNLAFLYFFRKEKKELNVKQSSQIALWMTPSLIIGAIIGGHILYALPDEVVKLTILTISCVGFIYAVVKIKQPILTEFKAAESFLPHWQIYAVIFGLFIGLYDGVSGAGSGILIILMVSIVFRLRMKTIFSVINIISTISLATASVTFLYLGLLSWELLIIMIPACILAGAVGAKIAKVLPEKVLRIIYASLMLLLISYLASELFWI